VIEPQSLPIVQAAFEQLRRELAAGPYLSGRVLPWLAELAHSDRLEAYFEHPFAYPLLSLPLWAGEGSDVEADRQFAADITFSNLCGYYLIRLLDDVMDADARSEPALLASAIFFQAQLQRPYRRYFGGDHPFWDVFNQICTVTADVTMRDADLPAVTREDFETTASQKVCGAKIPVAAMLYRQGREDTIPAWFAFIDRLGPPHQMLNDLMGWQKDLRHGHATYVLSEATRQAGEGEGAATWMVREGFGWGLSLIEQWVAEATRAVPAGSSGAKHFLATRQATLGGVRESLAPGLEGLKRLLKTAAETA
jgi:hypothetical protein